MSASRSKNPPIALTVDDLLGRDPTNPSPEESGKRIRAYVEASSAPSDESQKRRRKQDSERKTETLKLLVTADERIRLQKAADDARLSLSTWLRLIALQAAEAQLRGTI
jgi:hypothetical protein